MSEIFKDRERSYENKFAHDLELDFKTRARANKLFGEWAALEIGMVVSEVQDYVDALLDVSLNESESWDVISKITHDLRRHGKKVSEEMIREKYMEFCGQAAEQLRTQA